MNPFRCVLALCALAGCACGCSASDDSDVGTNRASDDDKEVSDAPAPRGQASTPSAGAPLCDAPLLPGYGYTRTASAWPGGTDEWWLAVEGPGYLALLAAPSDGGNYRYTDYRYTRSGWIGASEGGFIEDERGLRLLGYPAGNPGESCLAALRAPSTSPPRPTTNAVLAGTLDASVHGAPAGTALFVSVDEDGVVSVEYDNDEVLPIGNLVIARFAKESELRELESDVFVETKESGPPTFFNARASIESEARSK